LRDGGGRGTGGDSPIGHFNLLPLWFSQKEFTTS